MTITISATLKVLHTQFPLPPVYATIETPVGFNVWLSAEEKKPPKKKCNSPIKTEVCDDYWQIHNHLA